jgi:hypothetical protein
MLPNVPPTAKALIPKNIKRNRHPKIVASPMSAKINITGVIPSYSNAKYVFLSLI